MASVVVHPSSRVAPSSHQSFGLQNIFSARQLQLAANWDIFNGSSQNLLVDLRIRLNKRRGFGLIPLPDETWVEYLPGEGRIVDRFQSAVGVASIISPPFAIPLPPGQSTPSFTLILPGPGANAAALNFWSNEDNTAFNFLLELFQMPFNGATRSEGTMIGSHEYKDVFTVDVDPPPLSALAVGSGGVQPRLVVRAL